MYKTRVGITVLRGILSWLARHGQLTYPDILKSRMMREVEDIKRLLSKLLINESLCSSKLKLCFTLLFDMSGSQAA